MYTHNESITVNHNIAKVYSLVANIEEYPKFIPWISKATLLSSNNSIPLQCNYLVEVDFKLTKEKFITKDTFYTNKEIVIELLEGPFSYLYSNWLFLEINSTTTKVDFFIEFQFKSKLISFAFGKIFFIAQAKIMNYFMNRINLIK